MSANSGRALTSAPSPLARRVRLPADRRTPAAARAVVRAILAEAGLTDLLDEALLLTTELATNGVDARRHRPRHRGGRGRRGDHRHGDRLAPGPVEGRRAVRARSDPPRPRRRWPARAPTPATGGSDRCRAHRCRGARAGAFRAGHRRAAVRSGPVRTRAGPAAGRPFRQPLGHHPHAGRQGRVVPAGPVARRRDGRGRRRARPGRRPPPERPAERRVAFRAAADRARTARRRAAAPSSPARCWPGSPSWSGPPARRSGSTGATARAHRRWPGTAARRAPTPKRRRAARREPAVRRGAGAGRAALAVRPAAGHPGGRAARPAPGERPAAPGRPAPAELADLPRRGQRAARPVARRRAHDGADPAARGAPAGPVVRGARHRRVGRLRLAAAAHTDEASCPSCTPRWRSPGRVGQARLREAPGWARRCRWRRRWRVSRCRWWPAGQRLGTLAVGRAPAAPARPRRDRRAGGRRPPGRRWPSTTPASTTSAGGSRTRCSSRCCRRCCRWSTGIGFAAEYVPTGDAAEVGGDFYDVVAAADGRWLVVVGDVSGKGVQAAAVDRAGARRDPGAGPRRPAAGGDCSSGSTRRWSSAAAAGTARWRWRRWPGARTAARRHAAPGRARPAGAGAAPAAGRRFVGARRHRARPAPRDRVPGPSRWCSARRRR